MDTIVPLMNIASQYFGAFITAIFALAALLATLFVGLPRDLKDAHVTRAAGEELSRNQKLLIYGRLPVALILIGAFIIVFFVI